MYDHESDGSCRVAIYTRYSTGLQRASSTLDQIRECREAATRKGWAIHEGYIRSDEAVSGRGRVGRHGFEELIKLAQTCECPFDGILIDDTSRFGRNLSQTLPLSDLLEEAGIFLHFANRGLDSRDPHFRQLFVAYGQHDEAFSRALGEKVRRGQRGRVLSGYMPNGRVYGYQNVPIEHPTRKGLYGRPEVEAVKLEIKPEEAAVVTRIFELYQGGLGHRAIASLLNKEGIPSPLREISEVRRFWNTPLVAKILKNTKYRGLHIWNRTKNGFSATTQCKVQRSRPKSEWEQVEVPTWRIVSDELWQGAHKVNRRSQGTDARVKGGLNRTERSRKYIFSGLLRCAECGGNMNIVMGAGENKRYGCARHRSEGTCTNALTIKRTTLERTLLTAVSANLVSSAMRSYLAEAVEREVKRLLAQKLLGEEKGTTGKAFHRRRVEQLAQQADNLVSAIAGGFDPKLLEARLKSVQTEIADRKTQLAHLAGARPQSLPMASILKYVGTEAVLLAAKLGQKPEQARPIFAGLIKDLILCPTKRGGPRAFQLSGDLAAFLQTDPLQA